MFAAVWVIGGFLLGWLYLPEIQAALGPTGLTAPVLIILGAIYLAPVVFFYVLAALCLMVAIVTPIIELVPIAGIVPNAAICAYALAITAHDGLWALIAFMFSGASIYMIMMAF